MGVLNRGMELYYGYSDAVRDRDARKALIRRAAKAGLRSARAWWHMKINPEFGKAFPLVQAEVEGSASETEASGGPCVHAALMLGECYRYGRGVWKREARALELYHHAVEVDKNQDAMYELAYAYQHGQFGQDVDNERALSLYQRGAELGYYRCREYLGRWVYAEGGCGVEVDLKQALYWLEKASEQSLGIYPYHFYIVNFRERLRRFG